MPSITMPVPLISRGACLVQGFNRSGPRTVEKTLTTEFSMLLPVAGAGAAGAGAGAAGAGAASGVWARRVEMGTMSVSSQTAGAPRRRSVECIFQQWTCNRPKIPGFCGPDAPDGPNCPGRGHGSHAVTAVRACCEPQSTKTQSRSIPSAPTDRSRRPASSTAAPATP